MLGFTGYEDDGWWCFVQIGIHNSLWLYVLLFSSTNSDDTLPLLEDPSAHSTLVGSIDSSFNPDSSGIRVIADGSTETSTILNSEIQSIMELSCIVNNGSIAQHPGVSNSKLVKIKNLPERLTNCKKLQNFLWQYGSVEKICFVKSNENTPDLSAYIVARSIEEAERFVINIEAVKLFGIQVEAHILPLHENLLNSDAFELDDGSISSKEFPGSIICGTSDLSIPPTDSLRFELSGPMSGQQIMGLIEKSTSVKVRMVNMEEDGSGGTIFLNSVDDAIELLIHVNQKSCDDMQVLMRFETASTSAYLEGSTSHNNPNWLSDLKRGFKSEIIGQCSSRTKTAVSNNEYIKENYEFRKVKAEILSATMERVRTVFGTAEKPSLEQWREIAIHMAFEYSTMFRDEGPQEGRRPVDSIKRLGQKLADAYR